MKEKDDKGIHEEQLDMNVFEKTVKKAKRKSLIKTAIISVIAMIVAGFLFKLTNDWLIQKKIDSWHREEQFLFREPNTSIWSTSYSYDFFKVTAKSDVVKEVGGRIVPWDTIETDIYAFKKSRVVKGLSVSGRRYNENEKRTETIHYGTGERLVSFYHPKVNRNDLPNDFILLKELREDQLVELAVSFDRAYTPKEVESFFAKEHVNWLRIDSTTEEDILAYEEAVREHKADIIENVPEELREEQMIEVGEGKLGMYGAYPDALTSFYLDLIEWKKFDPKNETITNLLNEVTDENGEPDIEKFRIIGAIISGSPSELQQYVNKPFIRAVTLGATIDKY